MKTVAVLNSSGRRLSVFILLAVLWGICRCSLLAQDLEFTVAGQATQMEIDRLAPGEPTGEAIFVVDSVSQIVIDVAATMDGVTVSIEGPGGQTVDEANVGAVGGEFNSFEVDNLGESFIFLPTLSIVGFHSVFSLPSFGPGTYTVHFAADPGLAQEVAVFTQVFLDTALQTTLFTTERTVVENNPVVLVAAVLDGETSVPGATVVLDILPGSGTPSTLTLFDNGTDADDAIGDGLYSAVFTPTATGEYNVFGAITGLSTGGVPFSRDVGTSFRVVPEYGQLAGIAQDRGIDDDSDNLFEAVAIDVDVNALVAGEFRVSVRLETANGQFTLRSAAADLQLGQQTVSAIFEADALRELGTNGPYQMRLVELEFLSEDGFVPSGRLVDVGQTQAYNLDSDLEPSAITVTGVSDVGVDDDSDGLFDRLLVTVQANVQNAGAYLFNLSLTSDDLQEIDLATGSTRLNAGVNNVEVSFSGPRIRAFGASGPYRLRNFLLARSPHSLEVEELGLTQAYSPTQFDAPAPQIVSISPTEAQPGTSVVVGINAVDTSFDSGQSIVSAGAGITAGSLFVTGPTHLSAEFTVDPGAQLGPRTVSVTTVGETVSLENGFAVVGPPAIVAVDPASASPGDSLLVLIEGEYTHFNNSATLDMGQGITVQGVFAASPTLLEAFIEVDPGATPGPRTLTITTGSETAVLTNGFTILGGAQLVSVNPSSGARGETVDAVVTGLGTSFAQGVSTVGAGSGITVSDVTVTHGESLTARLEISPSATVGPRTITVTTGAEVVSLADAFTVVAGARLISISPGAGEQGQTVAVTIAGADTSFAQGATSVSAGAGITVTSVTVADSESVTASFAIGAAAALGPRTITVSTGSEIVSLPDAFTVVAPPPASTLSVAGDTYLKSGTANQNQGGEGLLRIQSSGNNRALVRFDQAAIDAAIGTSSLKSATLRLWIDVNADNWGDGREVSVHRMLQDWTEAGATWNCGHDTNVSNSSPDCSPQWEMGGGPVPFALAPADVILHSNGQSGWVEWDVTADVQAFLDETAANYGWIIRKSDEGQNGMVGYSSREGAFPPELVITPGAPGPPQASNPIVAADSYIKSGQQNQNQGYEFRLRLQASGNNRALLRIDQQAIVAAVGSGAVTAATLRLHRVTASTTWGTGREVSLHRLTADWTEVGVTWNCPDDANPFNSSPDCDPEWNMSTASQYPFASARSAFYVQQNEETGPVDLDVTADIQAFLAGAAQNFGWLLKKEQEGQSGAVEFASRESGSPAELILTVQ